MATGFTPPSWEELSRSTVEAPVPVDEEPNQPRVGWQVVTSREESFLNVLLLTLSNPDIAVPVPGRSFGLSTVRQFLDESKRSVSHSPLTARVCRLAIILTSLATTGRRVLWQEFSGAGCAFFGVQKSFLGIQLTKGLLGHQSLSLGIERLFEGNKKCY